MAHSETHFLSSEPWYKKSWFTNHALPAGVALVVAFAILAAIFVVAPRIVANMPSSSVKIELAAGGHGSGVYIGDGLILTAAHVAAEGAAVTVKLDDGTTRAAEVVWSSAKSDIALLRTSPQGISASPLSCAPIVVGAAVQAKGNPLAVEFITTYGHIIGGGRQAGDWAVVAPVDMTVLPGMSGGGIFNDAGEVVGISVAVMTAPLGLGASFTGIGFYVPSYEICGLLGRT